MQIPDGESIRGRMGTVGYMGMYSMCILRVCFNCENCYLYIKDWTVWRSLQRALNLVSAITHLLRHMMLNWLT